MTYQENAILTYYFYDSKIRDSYKNIPPYDLDDVMGFDDLSTLVYQTELLAIFNIDSLDDLKNEHYLLIENTLGTDNINKILQIIENANPTYASLGIPLLLSYDYFFIIHKLMHNIINNTTPTYNFLEELQQYVKSMNNI